MSKPNLSRLSLSDRLAAVAGPQISPTAVIEKEAAPAVKTQALSRAPKAKVVAKPEPVAQAKARAGKTMIAGYFTPQFAKAVKILAVERDTTVQALIGEGLDAVLHKNGKHPFGER